MTPTHAQKTAAIMATDAMQSLSVNPLFDVIEAHLEARPDIDPAALEAFGDKLARVGHMRGRE